MELLNNPSAKSSSTLPEDRPDKLLCFIARDDDFFAEVERLQKTIIFKGLEPQQAVQFVVNTGLAREEELRIAKLSGGQTLVHLPLGLLVHTLISSLPAEFWEKGHDAQPWSQLHEAELLMPRFNMIIDLVDFPLHLWKEGAIKKAVAGIGLYLGSIPPENKSDYSY